MRRFVLFLCLLVCLGTTCLAQDAPARRVYRAGECAPFAAEAQTLELYVTPLLGADCMVLTCGGKVMLVDMGRGKDYADITALLDSLAISSIDIAFNTHPHDDHLGSMKQLAQDYPIGVFLTAFPDTYSGESVIQVSTLKALTALEIPVQTVEAGDVLHLGDAVMTVMRQTRYKNPNPMSAMLHIRYGECTLLLAADVIGSAQQELTDTYDLSADILKFPHHGLNKLNKDFLDAISPEYSFFTHGYANTRDAQEQLDKQGIFYDFATWGVIHLSTNGEYWIVDQKLTEDGQRYAEKYR